MILAVVLGGNGSERDETIAQHIQAVITVVIEIIVPSAEVVHREGGCGCCVGVGIIQRDSISAVIVGVQVAGRNSAETLRRQAVLNIGIKVEVLVRCDAHGNAANGAGIIVVQIPAVSSIVADISAGRVEIDQAAAENIHALTCVVGCIGATCEGYTHTGIAAMVIQDCTDTVVIGIQVGD